MGLPAGTSDAKPICAVTFVPEVSLDEIVGQLGPVLGKPDHQSPVFDFDYTDYYRDEMGPDLKKVFLSFSGSVKPDGLVRMKLRTNELEAEWTVRGKRRINLDPGYMTSAKLVLASTKDFAHRIFLGEGIYGDVQLQFRHGRWRPSAWTFPDYRTTQAKAFFSSVRDLYNQNERRMRHALS